MLDGTNYYEDGFYKLGLFGINEQAFNAFAGKWTKIHLLLAQKIFIEVLRNPYYMSSTLIFNGAKGFFSGFGVGIKKIRPFLFEKYDERGMMDAIKGELKWEQPNYFPYPWRSDCDVALIKNYIYYKILGFSDYDDYLSNMIRDNMIERNEANERLQEINDHFDKSLPKIKELLKSYRVDSESVQMLENLQIDKNVSSNQ